MKKAPYLALVALSITDWGFALPQGGQAVSGEAAIQHQLNNVQITTSDRAIINWSSFNIGKNETVQFVQPSSSSAVLNRDIGGMPSHIYGALQANGHVCLINQSGLIIGQGAAINAASFIASTLDILNDRFMKGEDLLFQNDAGGMIQLGSFTCEKGDIILIGRQIATDGNIDIKEGSVSLGSGVDILVKPQGSEKIFIQPSQEEPQEGTGIDLKGTLTALQAELKADGNLYQMAIKNAAHVEAMTTVEQDGKIFLVAENGLIDVDGSLIAKGGEVRVLGDFVRLSSNADVDVSSDFKGGTVLIGGDFQGKNEEIHNAKQTSVAKEASIKADALINGNGGKVIVWSDESTGYYGHISAQGGPEGGDGGNVEVSGKYLDFNGLVSTLAPQGKAGNLLLDPVDVKISSAATSANEMLVAGVWTPTACAPAANIHDATLAANWGAGNVKVITTFGVCALQNGDILVDPTATMLQLAVPTTHTLTLEADRHIFVGANITNPTLVGGGGGITLHSKTGDIQIGFTAVATPAPNTVIVGVANGATTLLADMGDVRIGDFLGGFPAQVGWGRPIPVAGVALTGTISVTATVGSVLLHGGSVNDRSFAQIGHGEVGTVFGMQTTIAGVNDTSLMGIIVSAGTDVQLIANGFNANECYAQIGHGGVDVNNITNPISGNITIDAGGFVILQGGTGSEGSILNYAQVGHLGGNDIDSPMVRVSNHQDTFGDITIGMNTPPGRVELLSGTSTNGTRSWTHIGHGGDNIDIFGDVTGEIMITTAPTGITGVLLAAGLDRAAWAQIGHGGSSDISGLAPISEINFRGNTSTVHGDITISIPSTSGTLGMIGAQDPAAPGVFGIDSSVQIGHGGSFAKTTGSGGWTGAITITTTEAFVTPATSNILIEGGNCYGSFAQVGHGGPFSVPDFLQDPISVTGTQITITGATSIGTMMEAIDNGVYAQIGHGGTVVSPGAAVQDANLSPTSGELNGTITVLSSQGVLINGDTIANPTSLVSYGQIGHGSFIDVNVFVPTKDPTRHWGVHGDIMVTCTGAFANPAITLTAGFNMTEGGAWIGHGPATNATALRPLAVTGNITVNGMGLTNLTINGGITGAVNAIGAIGHGLDFPTNHVTFTTAAQTITANQISILAGLGSNTQVFLPATATILSLSLVDSQSITATAPGPVFPAGTAGITLHGGQATQSNASIYAFGPLQTITTPSLIAIGGQPVMGVNHSAAALVGNINPGGLTQITATNGDVIFFNGFSALLNPSILSGVIIPTDGAAISVQATGDIVLSNTISTADHTSNALSFIADFPDLDGFGAFKVDTSTYDFSGTLLANGMNGIGIFTSNGAITIQSSQNFHGYGQVAADFQIGNIADLTLAPTLYPADILSKDIFMFGNGGGPITVDPSGAAFNFQAYRNIFVTSDGVTSANDTVLLIAEKDIQIKSPGVVSGAGVTLVVDNQDPTSPNIGNGRFIIENGGTLSSVSHFPVITLAPLSIYTALRSQNTISAPLNGSAFVPGPLFINSTTEQWCTYFPTGPGHTPFKIFYKDCFVLPPPAVTSNQVSASQLFFYFDQWDHYLYWDRQFKVEYARDSYHHLDRIKWLTSLMQPYEKSHLFRSLLSGLKDQKPVWTFDAVEDRQLTLPPEWKADGTQYNTTVY